MKPRSNKQKCQFFRWRFKGFIVGQLSVISGFLMAQEGWLSDAERNRLAAIAADLHIMNTLIDDNTRIIIKEVKNNRR